ncbi:MAG TPA: hypothetical protein VHX88_03200 [Solirubrobacteraceae bacterium]|jgi:phage-related minor tail protein|nr:hypothetical protein [Solirubrobacteraceae bacterium]
MAQKAPAQPSLRRAFDDAERAVGGRLEHLTATEGFTDVLLGAFRVQRAIGRMVARRTEDVVHLAGLPTRRDVARLGRQMSALTAEVRELAGRIEEERDPLP